MSYISKKYLKEKLDDFNWAMEYLLSKANGDSISEDDVKDVERIIWGSSNAIIKELDI